MKKKSLLLLILIFIVNKLSAQAPPTPNASSFGIFNIYPKSSFSGVPNISVPIYDLSIQGLNLSIELSYNQNLVKPKTCGSWVGMGWRLSAGGTVTRAVVSDEDDANYHASFQYVNNQDQQKGYWHHHNLGANDWYSSSKMYDALVTERDFAPDEYSFSVGDLTGEFFLDHERKWKVRCSQKVVVEVGPSDFIYTPANPAVEEGIEIPPKSSLFRISLTDTKGIKYIFGGSVENIDISGRTKTWNLAKILFPNGDEISYEYEKGQNVAQYVYPANPSSSPINLNRWIFSSPSYLKKIVTKKVDIVFMRSENSDEFAKLDRIIIKNKSGDVDMEKLFTYDNVPMDRLTLTSVLTKGKNNESGSKYKFYYNPSFINIQNSYQNTDHWGFYNSKPIVTTSMSTILDSREPDLENSSKGVLSKIVHPTGGYTEYIWEPHTYGKEVSIDRSANLIIHQENKFAGGVRIKTVSHRDKHDVELGSKTYKYISNYSLINAQGISSGIMNWKPVFSWEPSVYHYAPPTPPLRFQPLTASNIGGHILYSEVTEIEKNGAYTTTVFSNFDKGSNNEYMDESEINIKYSDDGVPISNFTSNAHERGKPLSIKKYTNSGVLVYDKQIQYERINKTNDYARALLAHIFFTSTRSYYSVSAIKMYANSYLPSRELVQEFDLNGQNPVISEKLYTYDLLSKLKKSVMKYGNGDEASTVFHYVDEFVGGTNLYKKMLDKNMMQPIEERSYFKPFGEAEFITKSLLRPYKAARIKGIFLPESIFPAKELIYYGNTNDLQINNLTTTSLDFSGNGLNYYDVKYTDNVEFTNYDEEGNVLQLTTLKHKKTSFQMDKSNLNISAEVINAENSLKTDYEPLQTNGILNAVYGVATTRSVSFNHIYDGDITLSIAFTGAVPRTNFQILTTLSSGGQHYTQTLCFTAGIPNVCGNSPGSNYTYTNLPKGEYTLTIMLDKDVTAGVSYSYFTKKPVVSGVKEFFIQDFEDPTVATPGAYLSHTGNGCVNTPYYRVDWVVPNQKSYVISYFYVQNGEWKYSGELPYNNNLHIISGAAMDDIRIYPKDAQVTTFTYDHSNRMTSKIDAKGLTTTFEYDNFGRLEKVRDHLGKILFLYKYNYDNSQE